MNIVKERSRLIFTDYIQQEEDIIRSLVSTIDKSFLYKDEDTGAIYLPTGMTEIIEKHFKSIRIEDKSGSYWDYGKIKQPPNNFSPRGQIQVDSIEFALNTANRYKKLGLILNPGIGKTAIACNCAIEVGLKTLIIVPTSNIKYQWADTLIKMFNVKEGDINLVGSPDEFINSKADFTIILQSSLNRINQKYNLEKIMRDNKFGIKIIDECHMYFHNIIKVDGSSNILHNWYLTATFGRSAEEEDALYKQMFGDINIFRVPDKKPTIINRKPGDIYGNKPHMNCTMCWANSGLSRKQVAEISSSRRKVGNRWVSYGISVPRYTELIIPSDGTKTKFIKTILKVVKRANREVPYGKMLILSPTINSVEVLAKYVREMYPSLKVGTIHSRNKKYENDRVKAECDILISTVKSSGTGFDVKDLAKMVVAEQFKSSILAEQVSGRLRRRPDGLDTHMYDIVDSAVPQLVAWANHRAALLKKKSKKFKVVDM